MTFSAVLELLFYRSMLSATAFELWLLDCYCFLLSLVFYFASILFAHFKLERSARSGLCLSFSLSSFFPQVSPLDSLDCERGDYWLYSSQASKYSLPPLAVGKRFPGCCSPLPASHAAPQICSRSSALFVLRLSLLIPSLPPNCILH